MSAVRKGARLRAAAATVVDGVVSGGRSMDAALAEADVNDADKPLLMHLCYGTIRHHWRLRWQLSLLLDRPLKDRDSVVVALLTIGIYQLDDTRIPDHAAVSMTAEAAKVLRRPKYTGLINAVLRNYRRKNIGKQKPDTPEALFNHPTWLLERLQKDWPDQWQAIANANNERAPMWLRINSRKSTQEDWLAKLTVDDIAYSTLDGLEQAVRLDSPADVVSLPGFSEGHISVQDGGAQLAAPWLLAGGGKKILDACAAPGGKTGHLLELGGPEVALTAIDDDDGRLSLVRQNLERLGLDATVMCADASNPYAWWDKDPFDCILLDAPCSATGVIRRHPDIRLLRRATDIDALARLQRTMLEALWPLLKPGGRLLYVTCSVLRQENEAVISGFLEECGDASEHQVLPNNNIRDLMCQRERGYQLLPGTRGLDGFYFACLEKERGTKP